MRIEKKYSSDRLKLYFDRKPSDEVLNVLNSNHWKWDPKKRCWHNSNTHSNALLANVLLFKYLEEYIKTIGYGHKDFHKTLVSMRLTVNRMKQGPIKESTLQKYEQFVRILEVGERRIEKKREQQKIAEKQKQEALIRKRYEDYYHIAKLVFIQDIDKFWSDYDAHICYKGKDREGTGYHFIIKNPYSVSGYRMNYDYVLIQIEFLTDYTETGTIFFDQDEYSISKQAARHIVEAHMPQEVRKEAERDRKENVMAEVRLEALKWNARNNDDYGQKCLYCGSRAVNGNICPRCIDEFRKKRRWS